LTQLLFLADRDIVYNVYR